MTVKVRHNQAKAKEVIYLYGAILGDIIGSPYEFGKSKKIKDWR